jgi:dipeptidyl aminopeptidase/acylaminoacyl peptidase
MAAELIMPKWGLSMEEGLIAQWLKQEGEPVARGEPVVEVETEKMTNVVEAPADGVLARILYPEGSTVAVTRVIALIAAPGEAVPDVVVPDDAGIIAETPSAPPLPASVPVAPATGGAVRATPAARRVARERGVDLAAITGTGPDGMISVEDVERATVAAPAARAIQPLQKVAFYSDGYRLDGLLYTPPDLAPGERRPAVVLCAGYTYLKTLVMPDIAKQFVAAGYVALLFDYRGFGDSEGPRFRLLPHEQVADARAALSWLAGEPVADPARLAVLGLSLGGANAVVAAALDKRVRAAIAIEAPGDGERWLRGLRRYWEWEELQARLAADRAERARSGRSARVDPLEIVLPDPASRAFLEAAYREFPQMVCDLSLETADALVEYSPESLAGRIAPRPVCFIHGTEDRLVPPEESRRLYAQAGEPKRLELLPGLGHFDWVLPSSPGFAAVVGRAVTFLEDVLPARA